MHINELFYLKFKILQFQSTTLYHTSTSSRKKLPRVHNKEPLPKRALPILTYSSGDRQQNLNLFFIGIQLFQCNEIQRFKRQCYLQSLLIIAELLTSHNIRAEDLDVLGRLKAIGEGSLYQRSNSVPRSTSLHEKLEYRDVGKDSALQEVSNRTPHINFCKWYVIL